MNSSSDTVVKIRGEPFDPLTKESRDNVSPGTI